MLASVMLFTLVQVTNEQRLRKKPLQIVELLVARTFPNWIDLP